jgi:predicted amidohydrolase YtcJ
MADEGGTRTNRQRSGGLTRRQLIGGTGAAVGGAALVGASAPAAARTGDGEPGRRHPDSARGRDRDAGAVHLVNGRFVDGRGQVASALVVRDGRIAEVGRGRAAGRDVKVINLRGATVIPGFVNGHVHHSRTGMNAGREARDIETAFSIREVQEVLDRRIRTVPVGEWTGCHLGWHYVQLAENRPPTKAELDDAAPRHRVFLSGRAGHVEPFFSVTNSLGQQFFEAQGFTVDDDTGRILLNPGGTAATPEDGFEAIRSLETPEDRLRQTFDNNKWAVSKGMTTVLDPAGGAFTAQAYPAVEFWRRGMLDVRHRLFRPAGDPAVVTSRVQNTFRHMGDDMLREGGFGETIGVRGQIPTTFEPVAREIAAAGWKLQNHTDFFEQVDQQIAAFRSITAQHPIDELRWQLIHAFQVTEAQAQTLRGLGVGVDLELERYLDRLERGGGPFFRLLVDSGIDIGVGNDGSNFAPNNPWLMMFYMTTGISVTGEPNNADQTISRMEALRLFTSGSAFISFDEDRLGTFEVGKYADLAVLSHDFRRVSDDRLRRIKSVLTMVGGRIVHEGTEPDYAPIGTEFEFETGS